MSAVAQRAAFRGPAPLDCEIVADPVALKRLAPQWWNLWRDNPSATPFQSPAWLLSWWEAFAPGDLATIAVWAGGNLVGLAPLYIERSGAGDRLLPVGIGLSDYFDVLCAAGCAEQVVGAIGDAAPAIDWSQWSLENLLPDALALGIHCGRAAAAQTAPQATCPVLALHGDESLDGCVPTRRRRQLRRAHAAAGRRGRVSIGRVEMEYGRFLDHLMRLHGARWAGEGGGVLADDAVEEFHRLALPGLAARRLARCWTLAIDGRIVGAYYGLHHGGRAYAYLGGFDPAYADESPGSILIGHAIAEAIREGAREFNFLRGGEAYKYSWGAEDRWTSRRVLSRTPAR